MVTDMDLVKIFFFPLPPTYLLLFFSPPQSCTKAYTSLLDKIGEQNNVPYHAQMPKSLLLNGSTLVVEVASAGQLGGEFRWLSS